MGRSPETGKPREVMVVTRLDADEHRELERKRGHTDRSTYIRKAIERAPADP